MEPMTWLCRLVGHRPFAIHYSADRMLIVCRRCRLVLRDEEA
jgi:hypothetical protein